jgi:hypothetical protein
LAFPQCSGCLAGRPTRHFSNESNFIDRQRILCCSAVRLNILISNGINNAIGTRLRTQIIQIKERGKQIGKAGRSGNIAKCFSLPGSFPFIVPDGFNDTFSFFCMVIVDNFIPLLFCSVGVQEKEAFYRLL